MFDTHKLNDEGFTEVKYIKETMAKAVGEIGSLLPDGREKAIFSTKIEEAMFFATKGIASKPRNHTETITYPLQ